MICPNCEQQVFCPACGGNLGGGEEAAQPPSDDEIIALANNYNLRAKSARLWQHELLQFARLLLATHGAHGVPEVHARLAQAKKLHGLGPFVDAVLAECPDAECSECARIVCPRGEPLHFHHDGCPACAQHDAGVPGTFNDQGEKR